MINDGQPTNVHSFIIILGVQILYVFFINLFHFLYIFLAAYCQ